MFAGFDTAAAADVAFGALGSGGAWGEECERLGHWNMLSMWGWWFVLGWGWVLFSRVRLGAGWWRLVACWAERGHNSLKTGVLRRWNCRTIHDYPPRGFRACEAAMRADLGHSRFVWPPGVERIPVGGPPARGVSDGRICGLRCGFPANPGRFLGSGPGQNPARRTTGKRRFRRVVPAWLGFSGPGTSVWRLRRPRRVAPGRVAARRVRGIGGHPAWTNRRVCRRSRLGCWGAARQRPPNPGRNSGRGRVRLRSRSEDFLS